VQSFPDVSVEIRVIRGFIDLRKAWNLTTEHKEQAVGISPSLPLRALWQKVMASLS
jgi:hypothetical protein